MTPAVQFHHVRRHFGDVRAIDDVSFAIQDGEFFAMLGPSGSGKTTCLRLIAGFERPDSGQIRLHGTPSEDVPPYERDVNTVFQDYAVFPHMSVEQNVAYSLMVRGVDRRERQRRSEEMLSLVKLDGLGRRKPSQLSGGQRQRVALARALINRPRVLLLDEPLGALDLKLREQMQLELKALQRQLAITFVFVTHDQHEALAMSDRLAVFNHGRVEQIGRPEDVYEHPATEFVAGFVGVSNILSGEVAQRLSGAADAFSIRPEKITITPGGNAAGDSGDSRQLVADGVITDVQYHGASTRYQVTLAAGAQLSVLRQNARSVSGEGAMDRGDAVKVAFDFDDMQAIRTVPDTTTPDAAATGETALDQTTGE